MKKFISGKAFVLAATTLSTLALAQDMQRSLDIYNPRYVDRLCPPEYSETREWMESFIRVEQLGGKFRELFGVSAPVSMAEVEVLNDKDDAAACRYFSQRYDQMINRQVRLFDSGEAYYLHDLTFYKGGDFYFVSLGGGYIIDQDPKGSGEERRHGAGIVSSGVTVFRKEDFEFVDWEAMDLPKQ